MKEETRKGPDAPSIERVTRAAEMIAELSRLHENLFSPEGLQELLEERRELKEKLPNATFDIADEELVRAVIRERLRFAELHYQKVIFGTGIPSEETPAKAIGTD